jgi:uncharacterized membrane protein YozB (DUF420 family)
VKTGWSSDTVQRPNHDPLAGSAGTASGAASATAAIDKQAVRTDKRGMASSPLIAPRLPDIVRRGGLWAILAGLAALVSYTVWVALSAAWDPSDFPEALAVKLELLPVIFPLHMVTGALALLLVPLAWSQRRKPRRHRLAGRVAAIDVTVAGVTAFPVAWTAPVTFGSAAGFSAQALVWLTLLTTGIRAIRRRDVAAHRRAMLLMAATMSGAMFFRLYLALFAALGSYRHYELFYACDAWLAWLLPLIIAAWLLKRTGPNVGFAG